MTITCLFVLKLRISTTVTRTLTWVNYLVAQIKDHTYLSKENTNENPADTLGMQLYTSRQASQDSKSSIPIMAALDADHTTEAETNPSETEDNVNDLDVETHGIVLLTSLYRGFEGERKMEVYLSVLKNILNEHIQGVHI